MSGFLGPVVMKISSLLGITTKGQATMANSLPVALASNQSAVPVADNAGSLTVDSPQLPAALGQAAMAGSTSVAIASNQSAVPVSAAQLPAALGQAAMAGSTSVVIASNQSAVPVSAAQLPAALGQAAMAGSTSVVLASDQTDVPVSDSGGSLTVDSPQLPAALGQTTKAGSISATIASDQVVNVANQAHYYYGGVRSRNTPTAVGYYEGNTSKWLGRSGADDSVVPTDTLDDSTRIQKYFSAAGSDVGTDPIWIYIPFATSTDGYKSFFVQLHSDLGVGATATLYGVADLSLAALNSTPMARIANGLGAFQIATGTLADNATLSWGPNGTTLNGALDLPPAGYLVVKLVPDSDPTDEGWSIVCHMW